METEWDRGSGRKGCNWSETVIYREIVISFWTKEELAIKQSEDTFTKGIISSVRTNKDRDKQFVLLDSILYKEIQGLLCQ